MKRVAINRLGRIGRMVLGHYMDMRPKDVELVAADDLVPPDDLAYPLKYDSVHGRAPFPVSRSGDGIRTGDANLKIYTEKDSTQLPWKKLGVHVVIESPGLFTKRELADIADNLGVPWYVRMGCEDGRFPDLAERWYKRYRRGNIPTAWKDNEFGENRGHSK